MHATFHCGHPRVISNITRRKLTGDRARRRAAAGIPPEFQDICKQCYNKRMAAAQVRRRARLREFKDELIKASPPLLPEVER